MRNRRLVGIYCLIFATLTFLSWGFVEDYAFRERLRQKLYEAIDGPSIASIKVEGMKIGLVSYEAKGLDYSASDFKSECPVGDSQKAIVQSDETAFIMIKGCETPRVSYVPYGAFPLETELLLNGAYSLVDRLDTSNLCLKSVVDNTQVRARIFLVSCSGKLKKG